MLLDPLEYMNPVLLVDLEAGDNFLDQVPGSTQLILVSQTIQIKQIINRGYIWTWRLSMQDISKHKDQKNHQYRIYLNIKIKQIIKGGYIWTYRSNRSSMQDIAEYKDQTDQQCRIYLNIKIKHIIIEDISEHKDQTDYQWRMYLNIKIWINAHKKWQNRKTFYN